MIESLRLVGIAIVEEAELEFGPGLNVLTGETGAGKSIVLQGLALLEGAKASASVLRDGCEKGRVEALLRFHESDPIWRELEERGLDAEASAGCLVSRTIARQGRGRARIGAERVPVATLGEIFGPRIEISSQRESLALLAPEQHGRALDAAADQLDLRDAVAEHRAALRALDTEQQRLVVADEERARQRDFLRFQCEEIDAAALEKDELLELESLHTRLAHAEQLQREAGSIVGRLSGDAERGGEGALVDGLASQAATLAELAKLDPALAKLAEVLGEAVTLVREVASDLERSLGRQDSDPAALARVEERLGEIDALRRKYGADVEAIEAFRERIGRELATLDGLAGRGQAIESERATRTALLVRDAAQLAQGRRQAASKLARPLQRSLRELGMPDARFRVEFEERSALAMPDLPGLPGVDERPVFLFSANAGESLRPIHKAASGGELSRLFLALSNGLRREARGSVLVFDEVDAGVGGGVAECVGRVLAELGERHQVLCITHLPQVAALADRHFRVSKVRTGGRTTMRIEHLDEKGRVEEIARMAGGKKVTAATRRHARELLSTR